MSYIHEQDPVYYPEDFDDDRADEYADRVILEEIERQQKIDEENEILQTLI